MKKYSVKKVLIIAAIVLVVVLSIAYFIYWRVTRSKGMDYRESGIDTPAFGFGDVSADAKKRLRINFFR